ncbi:hypothetical protein MMC17_007753 [Xylographa soralifera]|nr:hypothetical protein [Xylographa soralifera]
MFQITILQDWDPIHIDALGIITLLGADDVSFAFGRLAANRYNSFLPTVGAYVFAANTFTTPIQGFQVYNIDDSIYTSDVPGWFARWLLSQNVKTNATKYIVSYRLKPRGLSALQILITIALGILAHAPIIVLSTLTSDRWGFANSILMALSTLSRYILIQQNKRVLDQHAEEGLGWGGGNIQQKTLWVLPTGDTVTIRAPKGLLVNCLLTNPKTKGHVQFWTRAVGWVAFGGFAVTLGMSTLFTQILTVVILLTCTCVVVLHTGDEDQADQAIGMRMKIERHNDPEDSDTRAEAYFKLDLNDEQERDLIHWSLFPQKTNTKWWDCYHYYKSKGPTGFKIWRKVQENYAIYGKPDTPPAPPGSY